ncbi:MAG: aldo/keto reductase [Pirellulaceae bacterium]
MKRRNLLKQAAAYGALAILRASEADAAETHQPAASPIGEKADLSWPDLGPAPAEIRQGNMLYRTLGRTGERISAYGLGGYHIGLVKEEQDSIKLIRSAIDRGITFMDNCWDYHNGKSEVWMGKALRDGNRQKVFLMTKIDGRTRQAADRQIDESLQRLQTDHVDLMQIHENLRMEDADRCFAEGGVIEALEAAKKIGKIRYIGFTGHKDPIVHNRMLDVAAEHNFHFDSCQMPLNLLDANFRSFARDVVPRLLKEGIAVLGMKPMASGAIVKNKIATPMECLTYALTLPTSAVITGIDSMDVLEQDLSIMKDFKPLDSGQMRELLARTIRPARTGNFEKFKTATMYDGTALHPEWLG